MKWEYAISAIIGVAVFFTLIGLGVHVDMDSMESRCLNSGRVVINHSVYECRRVGDEVRL